MGNLIRCIDFDGALTMMAVDSTDIINKMAEIHKTSPLASAALGRLLTGASLMGSVLKGADDSVTLRLNGGGPLGTLMAVSDSNGNVRGYVQNPQLDLPLNSKGKIDVAGGVGTDGNLTVIRDMGLKDPYIGQVPITSGEIAEDITYYYFTSEQTPTVCSLGVLVDRDLTVKKAGGFIIQLLPTAFEDTISLVEECIKTVEPVTTMLMKGLTPEEMCRKVLHKFQLDVLDTANPEYRCNCSRQRVERALISTGKASLEEMAEDEQTEVCCHFCDKKYTFTPSEVKVLIKKATKE